VLSLCVDLLNAWQLPRQILAISPVKLLSMYNGERENFIPIYPFQYLRCFDQVHMRDTELCYNSTILSYLYVFQQNIVDNVCPGIVKKCSCNPFTVLLTLDYFYKQSNNDPKYRKIF